jgi:hypothetical protein
VASPEINKLASFKTAKYKSKLLIIGGTKMPGSNFLRLANKFHSPSLFLEEKKLNSVDFQDQYRALVIF